MVKYSPYTWNDEFIYNLSDVEVNFLLNSRRLFDFGFGERFDEVVVKKMNLSVGLLLHTADVVQFDDSVMERFFSISKKYGVDFFYAIPTGYVHDKSNIESMEVRLYDPPLLGKVLADFEGFSKIRGGQIGLYSSSIYMFSGCLNFSILDVNGGYTLILGDAEFIEEVVGGRSWDVLNERSDFSRDVLEKLMAAKVAYDYV